MLNIIIKENITDIVKDFEVFCEYIDKKKIKLTKKKREIGRRHCFEINKLLNFKADVIKNSYPLESYKAIQFLFFLCIEAKLYRKSEKKSGNIYLVKTNRMDNVDKLNLEEKYIFLLEIYFIHYKAEGFGYSWYYIDGTNDLIEKISTYDIKNVSNGKVQKFKSTLNENQIFHMKLFKICDYISNKAEKRDEVEIVINEYSVIMCKLLKNKREILDWNLEINGLYIYDDLEILGCKNLHKILYDNSLSDKEFDKKFDKILETKEVFSYAFKEIFDNIKVFTIEEYKKNDLKGSYVFEISLENSVKTIKIPHEATLQDLHLFIQKIFNFDNDHFYVFYMDNREFSDNFYNDSRMDVGPYAEYIEIGELDLHIYTKFLYIFDFGHSWNFSVKFIDVIDESFCKALVLSSEGKPPKQYPDYDDY